MVRIRRSSQVVSRPICETNSEVGSDCEAPGRKAGP